jgi:hypothetical protein
MKLEDKVFECIDKGGRYRLVSTAQGAGTLKELGTLIVYRDEASGAFYARTVTDFENRMQEIPHDDA